MIQLISPDCYDFFPTEIREMHCLRNRIFKGRLNWDVETHGGLEADSFDALRPHYLIRTGDTGRLNGCVRLLPTTGPTMLNDVFPILLDGNKAPDDPRIWESSRFAIEMSRSSGKGQGGVAPGTFELFAAMVEFGLSRKLDSIVTVTDLRLERILRRTGWILDRIAEPKIIGTTRAVAGYLDVSEESLDVLRLKGGLKGPVLWEPSVHTPK